MQVQSVPKRPGRHTGRPVAFRGKTPVSVQLLPVSDSRVSINVVCRGGFSGGGGVVYRATELKDRRVKLKKKKEKAGGNI